MFKTGGWLASAALALVLVVGCGEATNGTITEAGVSGNNSGTFVIDTDMTYTVLIVQTDADPEHCAVYYCPPNCVITASFYMGSTNFTITAQPQSVRSYPPDSYVTSGNEDHELAAGTWNYTAVAQCAFDIDISPPSTPSP